MAETTEDILYYHEAMNQADKVMFKAAMKDEVGSHVEGDHWEIVHISNVPANIKLLPAVWAMRRKRRLTTGEICKWKARLNIDGSKQQFGINFWQTYAPVASWATIRLVLIIAIINRWTTLQIDYVMAFPQADAETQDLYMKIPAGVKVVDGRNEDYAVRIKKNLYGQKQAGRIWYLHLRANLIAIGFTPSEVDECLFYRGQCVYVLYTDDSILAGPAEPELRQVIVDLQQQGLKLTVEGDVGDFLGVSIHHGTDGTITMSQSHLVERILKDLRLSSSNVASKEVPAATSLILKRHSASAPFDSHFNYKSVIGRLNYLEKSSRPDIAYATHQLARFAANPREEHDKAAKWLGRYLSGSKDKGIVMTPANKGFECYVDADFAGNWDSDEAMDNADTARSRSGFVITYADCPIVWSSKLQTEISLSTTEAEYIALSTAMRDCIPMLALMNEMRQKRYPIIYTQPNINVKVYENNNGALEMDRLPKMRARTKHINVKYHHFRHHVARGEILVEHIHSDDQRADIFTKPTAPALFLKHRKSIMGW
jgi:hypothetical protein